MIIDNSDKELISKNTEGNIPKSTIATAVDKKIKEQGTVVTKENIDNFVKEELSIQLKNTKFFKNEIDNNIIDIKNVFKINFEDIVLSNSIKEGNNYKANISLKSSLSKDDKIDFKLELTLVY